MTTAPEQHGAAIDPKPQTNPSEAIANAAPTSPAPSDKSSDSEGRPVREKLKETRIDAQAASNTASGSDQPANNVVNGSPSPGEQSNSGSESERGRLRRKRSREDFEEEHEADKQLEKNKPAHDRHARKKSRDVTKDTESAVSTKSSSTPVERIDEADVEMTSPNKPRNTSAKMSGADLSPKNKRTRDQVDKEAETNREAIQDTAANGKPVQNGGDERNSKRPRDQEELKSATQAQEPVAKIPFGSGFSNTSAASPFAAMSPKSQVSNTEDKVEPLPQTSNDKFKSSGFGSFASAAVSPFGLASPKSGSSSPFGASGGTKLSSFAGSTAPPTSTGGGFSSSSKPSFGGSAFGGGSFGASSGGGFAGLGGAKTGLSSFAGSGGSLEITGLKSKGAKPFGAAGESEPSDDEDDDGSEADGEEAREERRSSQPLLSQQAQETGEEGDTTIWTGRAKLYTMAGASDARAWKERGSGQFKFNLIEDEHKKARFVLRADGTHRLLMNMLVTKNMTFGADAQGAKPKDGRLVFNEPIGGGVIETHLLKLRNENAIKLWEEVQSVQETEL